MTKIEKRQFFNRQCENFLFVRNSEDYKESKCSYSENNGMTMCANKVCLKDKDLSNVSDIFCLKESLSNHYHYCSKQCLIIGQL